MTLSHLLSIHCATLALCTAITISNSCARSERVSTTNAEKKVESTKTPPKKGNASSAAALSTPAETIKAGPTAAVVKPGTNSFGTIDISLGFSHVAEPALPSVVNIATTQIIDPKAKSERPQIPSGTPFDELFREFFDHQQLDTPRKVQSLGSGFIIRVTTDAAYIVTNNHVISDAKKITVYLHDKTELEAAVHAADERTDIAVLKVKLTDLPDTKRNLIALEWGNDIETRVGDWVLAIGNPFGLGSSVTAGIISSKGRDLMTAGRDRYVDDFLQHSAQINMGNSGGCLLNMKRQVVGVNTAIFSPTGGNVGVGFAVPSGVAKKTVDQLIDFGRTKRGWLGVRIQHLTDDMAEALGLKLQGAMVSGATNDGPAKKAGVQDGDIIIEYNGKSINDQNRLSRLVGETEIGKTVPLKVWRKGKEVMLQVTIGEYEEAVKNGKLDESDSSKSAKVETTEILGITLSPITESAQKKLNISPQAKGVLITKISPASAGEDAGLVAGEIIVEVNQKDVQKPKDVLDFIKEAKKNGRKNVMLLVTRKGEPRYPSLRIEDEPKKDESKRDEPKKDSKNSLFPESLKAGTEKKPEDGKKALGVEHPANAGAAAPAA
ncbi:MAG: Do family serine endopeptidase [Alphaproteobacteria bacterium]|nr:Do family serine endopeptidase [Alphaproteobacteria bacterium]